MAQSKVVWVTGAGTGIGAAAAVALARSGHAVVLSGRRREPLEQAAAAARAADPKADVTVEVGDLSKRAEAEGVVDRILARAGRIDAVVASAGVNVTKRMWSELSAADMDYLLDGNLRSQMYTVAAALPAMRARKDGLFVLVSSIAGRVVGGLSGPMYTTTKHAVTALSHSVNVEECINGIRSCALHPGEVDTPMLAKRPKKLTPEELARVLKPADVAAVIAHVVDTPAHVCLNEIWITPTYNRGYIAQLGRGS
ncbi:MAG: SDR family NAD(P)-dependent oxidoreductase [Alphaproteobacteria bacterium]|nr:SDR family NAD(P)-dependent oxidoreductase [Alphaproteobacteria bacterium]